MQLSAMGEIADQFWREIPNHFEGVCIDQHVVMPNHVHGIVVIERDRDCDRSVDDGDRNPDITGFTDHEHRTIDNGDHRPIDNGDHRPIDNGDHRTTDNGDHRPTDNGDHRPTDNGVETLQCNVSTGGYDGSKRCYDESPERDISQQRRQRMSRISPKPGSLGAIIRSYKSAVTRWCRKNGYDQFAWQPRFYEHIIRADGSIDRIRRYIVNNPANWERDRHHRGASSLPPSSRFLS